MRGHCRSRTSTREQIHRVDLAERERRATELLHQLHRRQLDVAAAVRQPRTEIARRHYAAEHRAEIAVIAFRMEPEHAACPESKLPSIQIQIQIRVVRAPAPLTGQVAEWWRRRTGSSSQRRPTTRADLRQSLVGNRRAHTNHQCSSKAWRPLWKPAGDIPRRLAQSSIEARQEAGPSLRRLHVFRPGPRIRPTRSSRIAEEETPEPPTVGDCTLLDGTFSCRCLCPRV